MQEGLRNRPANPAHINGPYAGQIGVGNETELPSAGLLFVGQDAHAAAIDKAIALLVRNGFQVTINYPKVKL